MSPPEVMQRGICRRIVLSPHLASIRVYKMATQYTTTATTGCMIHIHTTPILKVHPITDCMAHAFMEHMQSSSLQSSPFPSIVIIYLTLGLMKRVYAMDSLSHHSRVLLLRKLRRHVKKVIGERIPVHFFLPRPKEKSLD